MVTVKDVHSQQSSVDHEECATPVSKSYKSFIVFLHLVPHLKVLRFVSGTEEKNVTVSPFSTHSTSIFEQDYEVCRITTGIMDRQMFAYLCFADLPWVSRCGGLCKALINVY